MAYTQQQRWDRAEARKNTLLAVKMIGAAFANRENDFGSTYAQDAAFFAKYAAKAAFHAHPTLRQWDSSREAQDHVEALVRLA